MSSDTVAAHTTETTRTALQVIAASSMVFGAASAVVGRLLAGGDEPADLRERMMAFVETTEKRDLAAGRLVQALIAGTDTAPRIMARAWRCAGLETLDDTAWNELVDDERRQWFDTDFAGLSRPDLAAALRERAAPLVATWMSGERLSEVDSTFLAHLVALDAAVHRIRGSRAAARARQRDHDLTVRAAAWRTQADDRARLAERLARDEALPDPLAATSRLREALGPDAMARLRSVAADTPELARLARVLKALDQECLAVPSPAEGLGTLLALARNPGDVPLVAADPDPLLMAAFILERGAEGRISLPLPPGQADTVRRRAMELPAGVRLVENAVEVDCGAAAAPDSAPGAPETEKKDTSKAAIKEMVLNNMHSTSAILSFLRDARISSIPGLVTEVVNRTRNPQILETIATDRTLHCGFANRTVPLALLKSSVNVSIRTIRRFVHVKYVSKIDLKRMAMDKSSIRKEVCNEIEKYLQSMT